MIEHNLAAGSGWAQCGRQGTSGCVLVPAVSGPNDYSGCVEFGEYGPGDVVIFPDGPFHGICAVVRDVDARRARLRLDFGEGAVHREGNVLRERRHSMTVGFDEIELL